MYKKVRPAEKSIPCRAYLFRLRKHLHTRLGRRERLLCRFCRKHAKRHLRKQRPAFRDAKACLYPLVDERVIMLQRRAKPFRLQHDPDENLKHSGRLLGPNREVPEVLLIRGIRLRKFFYHPVVVEKRTVPYPAAKGSNFFRVAGNCLSATRSFNTSSTISPSVLWCPPNRAAARPLCI